MLMYGRLYLTACTVGERSFSNRTTPDRPATAGAGDVDHHRGVAEAQQHREGESVPVPTTVLIVPATMPAAKTANACSAHETQ